MINNLSKSTQALPPPDIEGVAKVDLVQENTNLRGKYERIKVEIKNLTKTILKKDQVISKYKDIKDHMKAEFDQLSLKLKQEQDNCKQLKKLCDHQEMELDNFKFTDADSNSKTNLKDTSKWISFNQ